MTGQEIHAKTCHLASRYAVNPLDQQKVRHFASTLVGEDDYELFSGLIQFFEESGYEGEGFWRQEVAGCILAYCRPHPQMDLRQIIRNSAPHYNLSVEQFPWYLALVFGRDEFRREVSSLIQNEELSERDRKTLDTYLYWTSISERQIHEELAPPK